MKYFLIAGEASGDLHGSNLMRALKIEDPKANFCFWGGDLMNQVSGELKKHIKDLAFMGFLEVVKNLKTILNNFKICKAQIQDFQPDVLILIDYPGFNLRIAKWAKKQGIKVFYYISPQLWAWHSSRAYTIKKCVDKLFVILPFEKEFYKKYDLDVEFVGHPLLDVTEDFEVLDPVVGISENQNKPIIALLPGSRKQEIKKMLNEMLKMVEHFKDYQFVIAGAPSIEKEFYDLLLSEHFKHKGYKEMHYELGFVKNQTYALLKKASAALVTSGTATLETALFEVPQVVCYKGSPISFFLAKRLVNVAFISLVNLIAEKEVVKELIQHDFNESQLKNELGKILNSSTRDKLKTEYQIVKSRLGGKGASKRTAKVMVSLLKK